MDPIGNATVVASVPDQLGVPVVVPAFAPSVFDEPVVLPRGLLRAVAHHLQEINASRDAQLIGFSRLTINRRISEN